MNRFIVNIFTSKLFRILSFILVFTVVIFFSFNKLGVKELNNADEGIYAKISLEMQQTGDYLVPRYSGHPWLEKPPLHLWLNQISFKFFDLTALAIRVIPALFFVLNCLLLYWWSKKIWNNQSGLLAIIFLIISQLFVTEHIGRTGDFDMALIFFELIALFSYWHLKAGQKWQWWTFGVAAGLAGGFWIKSLTIAPVFLIMFFDWLITNRSKKLIKQLLLSFLLSFVFISPWLIGNYFFLREVFIHDFWQTQIANRVQPSFGNHLRPVWWYLEFLSWSIAPFFYLSILAIINSFKNFKKNSVPLLWFLTILILFSSVHSKMHWHILPIVIPLLMILANFVWGLVKEKLALKLVGLGLLIIGFYPFIHNKFGYDFYVIKDKYFVVVTIIVLVVSWILISGKKRVIDCIITALIISLIAGGLVINWQQIKSSILHPQPSPFNELIKNYNGQEVAVYGDLIHNVYVIDLNPSNIFYLKANNINHEVVIDEANLTQIWKQGKMIITSKQSLLELPPQYSTSKILNQVDDLVIIINEHKDSE
jgi:4-amino-4-deoxy-L-arabinose transferase-like glycosyltransferase